MCASVDSARREYIFGVGLFSPDYCFVTPKRMTFTLQKVSAVAAILVISLLAAALFLGNQRQALALTVTSAASPTQPTTPPDRLGVLTIFKVYKKLNKIT